ncbi:hypothetical protein TVNIR_3684 [Thioalkalivibrio nitratireducens DSM 14787]|uniref:Uncharacterized protein n=1 Tax=Thioalkalivibrio nitratireducens (strain DSM 14787 / UNIQEM 213 / ALEN2) TaxID=1255043 RepID=L0E1Z4_THIND|nr:hypothetical protein TVNIR_3684 [Thioalkalivibrio nitratireducens DSM 14787]
MIHVALRWGCVEVGCGSGTAPRRAEGTSGAKSSVVDARPYPADGRRPVPLTLKVGWELHQHKARFSIIAIATLYGGCRPPGRRGCGSGPGPVRWPRPYAGPGWLPTPCTGCVITVACSPIPCADPARFEVGHCRWQQSRFQVAPWRSPERSA